MATRLYFNNTAAPYTPTTIRGSWNRTTGAVTKLLGAAHDSGAPATVNTTKPVTTNNYNVLFGRWISAPAAASGSLSGVVSWAIGAFESSASANDHLRIHIYVTTGDSDTPRGTLLSGFLDSANEFTTTAAGYSSLDQTISTLSVTAGDRVVVEVGYQSQTTSSSFSATMNYGGFQFYRDLVANGAGIGTAPATYFGWIQFSDPNHVLTAAPPYNANRCQNPAAKTYQDFWSTAAGTTVTQPGETGFSRSTGLHVVIGTAGNPGIQPSLAPASAGETWSTYVEAKGSVTPGNTTTCWLNFTDANGSFLSPNPSQNVTLSSTAQAVSFSGYTAPANTASVGTSVEGTAAVSDTFDVTCAYYDVVSSITAYNDGDSSGWAWDNGLTDGDSASRQTVAPDVSITGDSPNASRAAGPSGLGPDVSLIGDGATAQRSSGPVGTFIEDVVLTDGPTAQRLNGPVGTLIVDLTITDGPTGLHYGTPDGLVGEGVSIDGDGPTATYSFGPDGLVEIDLTITDHPRGARHAGGDGFIAVGLTIDGDGPSAGRVSGPVGSDFEDANPSVNVTDTPGSTRYAGPGGLVTISVVVIGDAPVGARHGGLDGTIAIDVLFTDVPNGSRLGGPDGVTLVIVGGTDTASASRMAGVDGLIGIVVPIIGDVPGHERYGGPLGTLVIGVGADVIAGPTPPSGVRLSGPDGQVLLAIIPARQPYVAPVPFVTPGYALWVADTRTGKMLWELPMTTSSWTQTLGDAGTIRTTLAVEQVYDSLSDQNERDPRVLLREVLTGPWRFTLVLKWGNNVVWAGPYVSMNRTSSTSLSLGGVEIGKLLSKRIMVKPGAVSAIDPSANLVIGPYATKPHAAYAIINQMLTGANNDLPFILSDPGGAGQDGRTYYGYDLADYWSKLQALSAEVDGPEVRFDPQISSHADGDYLSWVVQIGSPYVGKNTTTWMFDSDVTSVIGFDGDGSSMAFGVYAAGNGTSVDKLVSHAFNGQLLNIGWPMLESVDATHSSETVYPVLTAYANADLSAYSNPISSFQVQVPADVDPMVGTYHVGETFTIDVRDDPIIPDGTYTRRIAGITGTEKPWVTLTDTNATLVSAP